MMKLWSFTNQLPVRLWHLTALWNSIKYPCEKLARVLRNKDTLGDVRGVSASTLDAASAWICGLGRLFTRPTQSPAHQLTLSWDPRPSTRQPHTFPDYFLLPTSSPLHSLPFVLVFSNPLQLSQHLEKTSYWFLYSTRDLIHTSIK